MMKRNFFRGAIFCSAIFIVAGCSKTGNSNANYTSAINNYYKAHPDCLWRRSKRFPVQAATDDDSRTRGYDALTDARLLTRTTAERKEFILLSERVNNYNISPNGRSSWTQDTTQPGYGNLCYGRRKVTAINTANVTTNSDGAKTAQVNYNFKMVDVPNWAQGQEMQTAFPNLNSTLSGTQTGKATLAMNGNTWQVRE